MKPALTLPAMTKLKDILTPREMEIVSKVAEGLSNADAAKDLGVSVWGVKRNLVRIMDRVGCDNRAQLAVRYVREQGHEAAYALGRSEALKEALEVMAGEHYGHDTGELYDRIYDAIRALEGAKP